MKESISRRDFLKDYEFLDDEGRVTNPLTDEDCVAAWDSQVISNLELISLGYRVKDLRTCPIFVIDWPSYFAAMTWTYGDNGSTDRFGKKMLAIAKSRQLL